MVTIWFKEVGSIRVGELEKHNRQQFMSTYTDYAQNAHQKSEVNAMLTPVHGIS